MQHASKNWAEGSTFHFTKAGVHLCSLSEEDYPVPDIFFSTLHRSGNHLSSVNSDTVTSKSHKRKYIPGLWVR